MERAKAILENIFFPGSPGSKSTACIQGRQRNPGDPKDVDHDDEREFSIITERNSRTRPLEVRLSKSSDEMSESSRSEVDSKKWIGYNFLAPFSVKQKRDNDEFCAII